MYEKSDKRIDKIIQEKKENTELLHVNFDIRFKILADSINNYKN